MGLFSEKFEKEEREFIKAMTEKGFLIEELAIIRKKYGIEFESRESFVKFQEDVYHILFDTK